MGIYDRAYYRDETGGSGWLTGVAPVCRALIIVNAVVFIAQWILRDWDFVGYLGAHSQQIFLRGWVWQLLTATFLHREPFHILINMLVLWWVGRELESMYGSREFLALYLTAAVSSTLCWAVVDRFMLDGGLAPMLGASGAITALFVIYAMYYPRREILVFFVLPMPIWVAAALFIGLDALFLVNQIQTGQATGVAFASHLGGALYGFLYKKFDLRWSRILPRNVLRPRLRMVMPEPFERELPPTRPARTDRSAATGPSGPRPTPTVIFPPEKLDERLDEILAKIAREGRGSLSDEENQILMEASRRARDRRGERIP